MTAAAEVNAFGYSRPATSPASRKALKYSSRVAVQTLIEKALESFVALPRLRLL